MTLDRISMENNEIMRAGGRPQKGENSPKLSVCMPQWMIDALSKYAKEKKISRSEAVRQILKEAL